MSSQPPFSDEPNPYARNNPYSPSPNEPINPGSPENPSSSMLKIPAIILLIMAGITLGLGVIQVVSVIANGVPAQPNQDPAQAAGFKIGFWFSTLMIPVLNSVVIAGCFAMLTKRMHGLAIAGAACAIVPVCGPCFVLGMPFGIWALILLLKPEVKATFA